MKVILGAVCSSCLLFLLGVGAFPVAWMWMTAGADVNSQPSPFGIGSCYINNRSVDDNDRWIPQIARLGVRHHRSPHVDWGRLEKEPGVWEWDALDEQIAYLDEFQFQFDALLVGNPQWNEHDEPGSLPVNNLAGWKNYVTQLVRHMDGRTRCYEVWNEPPNFTGKDQTAADYAKMVVAAHDAAKAVDSSCQIGLAAKSVHVSYLQQTIEAGAKDHFDYIVLHPYEVLGGVANNVDAETIYMNIVPVVRRMLDACNPERRDVPIVFTELGVSADKGEGVQADTLVKAYVMGIAQGVKRIDWFEGRDGDSGPLGLLDQDGRPRPAYLAYRTLVEQLGPHPELIGWTHPADHSYAFYFRGPGGNVMVAWSYNEHSQAATLQFPGSTTVIDPATRLQSSETTIELNGSPLFVIGPPAEWIERARSNLAKPFGWNTRPDPSDQVSIEFGDPVATNGLFTRSGDHVAEAVVAYGGSARAGNLPGGNVFVVDPKFLSYEKHPIEITAVVRRNEQNDNAGFKLIYESPEGFKTADGWYTIPDNKSWHEKTWRIDDPRFVNYWGYNFALESDGNDFNKYLIKSVSVRKLKDSTE